MKIAMRDGRVLSGTALQIVKAMQDLAFGADGKSVRQYVEGVVEHALRFEEVELHVQGSTDDELAGSLVEEMLRTELAARL